MQRLLFARHGDEEDVPAQYTPTDEESAQAKVIEPWEKNYLAAERITYVMCALVIVAALIHAIRLVRELRPRASLFLAKIPGLSFLTAICRFIGYRRFKILNYHLSAGHYLVVGGAFVISTVVWVFALTPHYRPHFYVGSPPLAIRAGMLGTGLIPFIFSCALKFNPISLLTGLSHAQLQFYHQTLSVLFLFFSIVHAVPFIWQPLRDDGYAALKYFWYSEYYIFWTGTVAIFVLLWMVISSLGVFRNMSYEFFVLQHIASVFLLFGFLFAHFDNLLRSTMWLWATMGIWIFSVAGRGLLVLFSSDYFTGSRAKVQVLTEAGKASDTDHHKPVEYIRMTFDTPLSWHPGQHVYVRFPGVAPLQAHPFTCLSLPSLLPHLPNRLVLLARVHKGITRRIYDYCVSHNENVSLLATKEKEGVSGESSPTLDGVLDKTCCCTPAIEAQEKPSDLHTTHFTALLDGPYGYTYSLGIYEHNVLFAAGSGITFVLPQVSFLLRETLMGKKCITKHIRLVWVVRSLDIIRWVKPELMEVALLMEKAPFQVDLDVYATGSTSQPIEPELTSIVHFSMGARPDIKGIMDAEVSTANEANSSTMSVNVCGPKSLIHDISNYISSANARLAFGKLGSLRDLRLISESFSF